MPAPRCAGVAPSCCVLSPHSRAASTPSRSPAYSELGLQTHTQASPRQRHPSWSRLGEQGGSAVGQLVRSVIQPSMPQEGGPTHFRLIREAGRPQRVRRSLKFTGGDASLCRPVVGTQPRTPGAFRPSHSSAEAKRRDTREGLPGRRLDALTRSPRSSRSTVFAPSIRRTLPLASKPRNRAGTAEYANSGITSA